MLAIKNIDEYSEYLDRLDELKAENNIIKLNEIEIALSDFEEREFPVIRIF